MLGGFDKRFVAMERESWREDQSYGKQQLHKSRFDERHNV